MLNLPVLTSAPCSSWYRSCFLLRYWCSYVAVARWVGW